MIDLTPEQQIAQHYSAAMDSVNLINAGQPEKMTDAEWADCLSRNQEHLQIQLAKADMYAGYNLKPFEDAVNV